MPFRPSIGRNRSGLLASYVKEIDEPEELPEGVILAEGRKLFKCGMAGCMHQVQGKMFGASRWFKHLVCECQSEDMTNKKRLNLARKTNQNDVTQWKEAYMENEVRRQERNMRIEEAQYAVTGPQVPRNNPNRAIQATLQQTDFADHCGEDRGKEINAAVCEFLVYNALSFRLVESPAFLKMVKLLNSAYKPSKKDCFRTTELDNLYDRTVLKMKTEWRLLGNPMKTMGFDGYTDNCSNSVLNITVSALGVTACEDSIDPGTHSENAEWLGQTIVNSLQDSAKDVEKEYAGLVCDNTITNMNALDQVIFVFKKLIPAGCVAHLSDLTIEDIFKIREAKEILDKVRSVTVFVRSHRRVKKLYLTICKIPRVGGGDNGKMLKLFSDTRFSYGDLTMQEYMHNKYFLEQLAHHPEFEEICETIRSHKVNKFKDIVTPTVGSDNYRFDTKVMLLHELTRLVCKMIHHVEQKLCKASWVNALFFALMKDFDEWSNNNRVNATFDSDFINSVHESLVNRWRGEREDVTGRVRNLRPFKSKVWTAAAIFDPYYTPTEDEYARVVDENVLDYVSSVKELMEPYVTEENRVAELLEVQAELNDIVLRRGHWGDLISSFQRSLPPPPRTSKSNVEKEIFKQNQMRPVASFWETMGKAAFPRCSELALRLSIISVQSADVERMCKAHSLIHTKTRNRLQHKRVKKLLYCYINLRFIENSKPEPDEFLLSVDDEEEDEEEDNNGLDGDAEAGNIELERVGGEGDDNFLMIEE